MKSATSISFILDIKQLRRKSSKCGKRIKREKMVKISLLIVRRFVAVKLKDIVEIRLSYLYQEKHGKWIQAQWEEMNQGDCIPKGEIEL